MNPLNHKHRQDFSEVYPEVCPVCESLNIIPIPVAMPQAMRSDGLIIPEPLLKSHCLACGLLVGSNQPLKNPYHRSDGRSTHDLKRHQAVARGIRAIMVHYSFRQDSAILEVGAASFASSLHLSQLLNNSKITALEPSPEQIPETRDIRIVINDFQKHPFTEPFDLIFSNQVIEHLPDTRGFLKQCLINLKDEGLVLVCCPASQPVSNELLFTDHLYHFTSKAMAECAQAAGLMLIDQHQAEWDPLTWVYVLAKSEKWAPTQFPFREAQELYEQRCQHLEQWSHQDEQLAAQLHPGMPLALFGAGEFSQLIRAYLPKVYDRVELITTDSLTGSRIFDKPKVIFSQHQWQGYQILLGVQPASRNLLEQRLTEAGIQQKYLHSLTV